MENFSKQSFKIKHLKQEELLLRFLKVRLGQSTEIQVGTNKSIQEGQNFQFKSKLEKIVNELQLKMNFKI